MGDSVATILRRGADLQLDWDSQGVLWAASREAGVRISLPAQAAMLLDAFDGQRSTAEVLAQLGAGPEIGRLVELLHARGVLVDDTFSSRYFQNYHLGDHHAMLRDRPRMQTYRDAIFELVGPESVVADCGTGTGILALFAAQAGAKHVYAIEGSPWIDVARQMAEVNGFGDKITFVRDQMERVHLPEKVDIILSECMDSLFIDARMIPDVFTFRDHNLAPGGVLVPHTGRILLAPVTAPTVHADWMSRWTDMAGSYDLDFSPLASLASTQSHRRLLPPDCLLSAPATVSIIDLHGPATDMLPFASEGAFQIHTTGVLHGLAGTFEADLSPLVVLSTSPSEPATHWQQHYFPLPAQEVTEGDVLSFTFKVTHAAGNRRRMDATLDLVHRRPGKDALRTLHRFLEF